MQSFWYYAYNIVGVPLILAGAFIASLINSKIRRSLQGRKELFPSLEAALKRIRKRPRIWIHNSSMGEFEQAKPIIRGLKETLPECAVIVTFFSPSGYDHGQNFPYADYVTYIPLDTKRRARRFIGIVRPDVAVFIRHDLWPNHLREAEKAGIPRILINCSLPALTRNVGAPFFFIKRFVYDYFNLILTVSDRSKAFCEDLRLGDQIVTVGDTRFDQAVRRAEEAEEAVTLLEALKGGRHVLVAGSTWPPDEDVFIQAVRILKEDTQLWLVLVPHEPTEEHLRRAEESIAAAGLTSCRYSNVKDCTPVHDVLLVDRMGILAGLYALGDVTYVGGGFTYAVHNVLEPAAQGKVVLFGPKHTNSHEALLLKTRAVGYVVTDEAETVVFLSGLFKDTDKLKELGQTASRLVRENVGATERILEELSQMLNP